MTKGAHVVSYDVAMQVLEAVRTNATDVTIAAACGGTAQPRTFTLVVSHVVSLMQHAEADVPDEDRFDVWRPAAASGVLRAMHPQIY